MFIVVTQEGHSRYALLCGLCKTIAAIRRGVQLGSLPASGMSDNEAGIGAFTIYTGAHRDMIERPLTRINKEEEKV